MISPSEKIRRFVDIEELKVAIKQDLDSKDVNAQRYSVRFIMLNDFNTFRSITTFLCKEMDAQMFELQLLMLGDDKTIPIDRLGRAIKDIPQTSIVVPFSELVRFYKDSDFNGFFNEIILTEDLKHPRKRIYIPIVGLNNRFTDFLKNFGRIDESAPIWQLYAPCDDKVTVFVSKYKSPTLPESSEYCVLDTMKDWLEFWRKQAPRDKILCSALPIWHGWRNARTDSIFTFTEITNPHEFINDFLGITIPFEYSDDETEHWEHLLQTISNEGDTHFSWKEFVEARFGTFKFTIGKILEIWGDEKSTPFDRWLLKNYLLHTGTLKDMPYFEECLKATTDYVIPAALFVEVAQRIFYVGTDAERTKFFDERRSLMQDEKDLFSRMVPKNEQEWIMEQQIQYAQQDNGLDIAKKLATSTFDFEKELFFGWYQLRSGEDFGLKHLRTFYPDLYAYLMPTPMHACRSGAEWLANYFDAYREAKVMDRYTDSVRLHINTKNGSDAAFWDWYYKHNTCRDLYCDLMNDPDRKPDKVYWIDGLGVEFLPFILHLIETSSSNYEVVEAEISTTGLPSNTTLNRFEVDGKTHYKYGDLDELIHGDHYQPRKTLIRELEVVRKIIGGILRDNSVGNHTIAIVSDHGLSALSRLCEPKKLTGKAHHEGRYIPYSSDMNVESMPEYITAKNHDDNTDYKIALTHSSLGRKPSHEVHGGCTPEEVLVPFIVITNNDASKPIKYEIKNATKETPLSNPQFECIIVPKPKSAVLIVGNKRIAMTVNNTTWSAKIPEAVEGQSVVGVLPYKGKEQNFDIRIFGLGIGQSLIDDDF